MLLELIRPSLFQNWCATHSPTSLRTMPQDSLFAFLTANGGTGSTIHDAESSYLTAQGAIGSSVSEQWAKFVDAQPPTGGQWEDKLRTYFSS